MLSTYSLWNIYTIYCILTILVITTKHMKYISVRSLVIEKKLGGFSEGPRPLSYATTLRRVVDHVESGNEAKFITIGDGRAVRYAIKEENIPTFVNSLFTHYI